jgi:phosphatidylserine/phosphatidylglycerophosphate/cardiolipin synthase-like enzyme
MTRQSSWASAFTALARSGVKVRTYSSSASLYIHAKAIDVDPGRADQKVFVGSQNFSLASLLYNRELGLITPQSAIVAGIAAVIRRDGAAATLWSTSSTPTASSTPKPNPSL